MSNDRINRLSVIGGEPDLTWTIAPDGLDRAIMGRTLEGDQVRVRGHLDPQTAEALVEAYNRNLAALSVWWRRRRECELAYYRSLLQEQGVIHAQ